MTRPKHRVFVAREELGYIETLKALEKAIKTRSALKIVYSTPDTNEQESVIEITSTGTAYTTERTIYPVAFYRRRRGKHTLYLSAWCALRNEIRSFIPKRISCWAPDGRRQAGNIGQQCGAELRKFEDSFTEVVELELIEAPLETIIEFEPAADALYEGDLQRALEVLCAVRPEAMRAFAQQILDDARHATMSRP